MNIISMCTPIKLIIILILMSVINFFEIRLDVHIGGRKLLSRFYIRVVVAHSLLVFLLSVFSYLTKGLSSLKLPRKFKVSPIEFPFFRLFSPLLLPLSGFRMVLSFFRGASIACGSEVFFMRAFDSFLFGINLILIFLMLHLAGVFFLVTFGAGVIIFRLFFYSLVFFSKLYELIKTRAMVIYYVALYLATLPKRVRKAILCFLMFYHFTCLVTLGARALVFAREHKLFGVIEFNAFLFWVKEFS